MHFIDLPLLEWFGYAASILIAISMAMSSIVKFRLINLAGAASFSTYGFLIGALPVGFMNLFIVCMDLYYLYLIFRKHEAFETLSIRPENKYLNRFLDFHEIEIQKFFPGFSYDPKECNLSFFVLRNMSVAGVFLAKKLENNELYVHLDYVIPEYRDFKSGQFVYRHLSKCLLDQGITKVISSSNNKKHGKYLKKLGFIADKKGNYSKIL